MVRMLIKDRQEDRQDECHPGLEMKIGQKFGKNTKKIS
jgi:hypothetical protein